MMSADEKHVLELETELAALLRAGCAVHLDPLGNGLVLAKITPPTNALDGVMDYTGLPARIPFVSQFNIIALNWDLPRALRKARRLFISLAS